MVKAAEPRSVTLSSPNVRSYMAFSMVYSCNSGSHVASASALKDTGSTIASPGARGCCNFAQSPQASYGICPAQDEHQKNGIRNRHQPCHDENFPVNSQCSRWDNTSGGDTVPDEPRQPHAVVHTHSRQPWYDPGVYDAHVECDVVVACGINEHA